MPAHYRQPRGNLATLPDPDRLAAQGRAAGPMARFDQALQSHPLLPAFLHRPLLGAVRRQAAVDGNRIDPPWRLPAELEALQPAT